jgi:hypothetical protein
MIWTLQVVLGRFFDGMVSQVVDALGGGRRSSPWSSPRREPPSGRSAVGGSARSVSATPPAAIWKPVRDVAAVPAATAPCDKDLRGDDVKLVSYNIISLQPCDEKILPGGSGEVLVTESMTAESFATWIVASYLQSEGHDIPHDEKKYLRVAYEVLTRWPREPKDCCEDRELGVLEGIRDALRVLPRQPSSEIAAAPASIPAAERPPIPEPPPSPPTAAAAEELAGPPTTRRITKQGEKKTVPLRSPAPAPAPAPRRPAPARPQTEPPAEDRDAAKRPRRPSKPGRRPAGPTRRRPR